MREKNTLVPTITYSGLMVESMLNGLFMPETVFGMNGIGQWAVAAIVNPDIGAVAGFTMLVGVIFILANLIVNTLYA